MSKSTEKKPAVPSASLTLVGADDAAVTALAAAGIDDTSDGMGECGANDFRTPALVFNQTGKQDLSGRTVSQDEYLDTVEKLARKRVRLAMLELHKSNSYSIYEQREQRTRRVCSSFDQRTGIMEDGSERPCKGCPDAQWRMQQDGKRRANCAEVWNVFAYDIEQQKVVVLRFKRSSLDAIRSYLQQHHFGKRPTPRGRGNIPLFTYEVTASLVMDRSGKFAVPVLERGGVFEVDGLRMLAETSAAVRETLFERYAQSPDEDTSFDTEAMDAAGNAPSGGFISEAQGG